MPRNAPVETSLHPLTEADMDTVIRVGRAIWLEHYVPLIGRAQVDYMMAMRFTPDYLRRYLHGADRWLDVLTLRGEAVGYCSYALSDAPGEMKLEQLYLAPARHGCGLGYVMLQHVEARARALGCSRLMLQVNKGNAGSLAFYRKTGFGVREEKAFDIGQGFVMDDYIMDKPLEPAPSLNR